SRRKKQLTDLSARSAWPRVYTLYRKGLAPVKPPDKKQVEIKKNIIIPFFDGALPRQKHLPLAPTKEAGAEERSRRDEREHLKREPSDSGSRLKRGDKVATLMGSRNGAP
ncbi:MAG: hypothetical protein K6A81_00685, partial [Clostridiales bacterium]|nr:hypothetical protein [Clostridiales bacterium]